MSDTNYVSYTKSPASIKKQLETLESRGCIINDREYAEKCLTRINYYRLAHYFAPFRESKGRYAEGTTFEAVMKIYDFDRCLRRLIMSYLEEIEVYFRALVSNYHAMKYGALGYLNEASFDNRHNHPAFISKIDRLVESNVKEDFIIHHKNKYGGVMPLWAVTELFSFGTLAYFYADMKEPDQKEIADKYFGLNYRCIENRLMCMSDLRNACAHYSRLYGNPFRDAPKIADDFKFPPDGTLKSYLVAARSLYHDKDEWDREFVGAFDELVQKYDMADKLSAYGY
ncbi:MAG: Abi family protein [Eubacterium sp.]|nr:Abi family protein [Eubacterium sp.]